MLGISKLPQNIDFSVNNYSECVKNLFNPNTYLPLNANLYRLVVLRNILIVYTRESSIQICLQR